MTIAVKLCPQCGESNQEGSMLCLACHASLRDVPLTGTPDAEKSYDAYKYSTPTACTHCGEKLDGNAVTCKYCGQMVPKFRKVPRVYYSSQPSAGADGGALILLFLATFFIPLVGLIVGGIFCLNDDPDKQSIGKGLLAFGLVMLIVGILVGMAMM